MRFSAKVFVVVGVLILLTSFQNCGQPGSVEVNEGTTDAPGLDPGTASSAGIVPGGENNGGATNSGNMVAPATTPTAGTVGPGMPPVSTPMPPKYLLKAQAFPALVKEKEPLRISVSYFNLSQINYSCRDKANTTTLFEGKVSIVKLEGVLDLQMNSILSDMICKFTGDDSEVMQNPVVRTELAIEVNCLNRVKNAAGRCEDFRCLSFVELTTNELARIPARTSQGICYTKKLMSRIKNSKSSLTLAKDPEVLSLDHDTYAVSPSHPYVLGEFHSEVSLQGERVVKLSGGQSASQNILVDNFLLLGTYPASIGITSENIAKYYKVRGTSDSAFSSASGLGVHFNGNLLNVIPFGSGGTSSIAPIDISAEIEPGIPHTLDIRALDCGGARELSDIYLLFQ